jgi:hypothetical protein
MRKLLNRKIIEQNRKCAICKEDFTDYYDIRARPQGSQRTGRSVEDDDPDNVQAPHWCNREKGSAGNGCLTDPTVPLDGLNEQAAPIPP